METFVHYYFERDKRARGETTVHPENSPPLSNVLSLFTTLVYGRT